MKIPTTLEKCLRILSSTLLVAIAASAAATADDPWDKAQEIADTILAPEIPSREMDAGELGAIGDGQTDDLPLLQKAIDELSLKKGGRLVLGPGNYFLAGPLNLKSHVELHLAAGAKIIFSSQAEDYLPPVLQRWEGTLLYNYSPLIYAYQAHDVAITGQGTINGNASNGFGTWRPNQKPAQENLRAQGNDGIPVQERVYGEGSWLRPSMIQLYSCERVRIEGVTIVDSPFWIIHPVFSSHVHINGVTVDSHRLNNDGVDPDSCNYVLIENSTFRTGDDAVAIKSGRDAEGRALGVPSENIVIRNNRFESVHNGVAIGSEMSGSVRNVFVENNRIGECRHALYLKSNLDRGGIIEDIYMRDIAIDTAKDAVIRIQSTYHSLRGGNVPPLFRHVYIENITAQNAPQNGIHIDGHPSRPTEKIFIENVSIASAATPLKISPADEVHLKQVTINGQRVERILPQRAGSSTSSTLH